jgi:hypothetical protein
MARRNADQLDLLSYRPSVPVLPTPTVTREDKGVLSELVIKWTAPEGTEIVASDEAEFNRMVESIFDTMEAAGIVSFLRWKAQRRGLRQAFREMFYWAPRRPVAEFQVSTDPHSFEWDKPRQKEIGYNGINIWAYASYTGAGVYRFSGRVSIKGMSRDTEWRWLY